jgi:predicted LPLAT superfamily acyltransferase
MGRWARSYRHFLAFARTLVDRALLATRGPTVFRYQAHGLEFIRTAAAEGRGAILLTAHLGNWELAAGMLEGLESKLAIVAFQGEHERLARFLERAQGPRPRIIQVGTDLLASLEILQCLREGMLVALQGDRPLDDRVVKLPFLGREAPFPVGPFLLAAISGAPLIATFSVQTAPAHYRFFAETPMRCSFAAGQSRDATLRTWVLEYVRVLESVARDNPYQWFNFYDFWDAPPPRN